MGCGEGSMISDDCSPLHYASWLEYTYHKQIHNTVNKRLKSILLALVLYTRLHKASYLILANIIIAVYQFVWPIEESNKPFKKNNNNR